MNNIIFRPAMPQDASAIVPLILAAGGGIFEFLLSDLLVDITLEELLISEIIKETGNLSYSKIEVAQINHKIVGLTNIYPAKDYGITEEMRQFLAPNKLDWLTDLFTRRVEDSLLLNILAVAPQYQRQGIGTKLINRVKEKAQSEEFSCLSLTVWTDNLAALQLYQRQGFQEVKPIQVNFHPLIPHHGGLKLMQCLL
ncbi:GNAT family N-acetyltransferase [Crocosphaera sp. XPORK-15E]|uniref:GNAT family N-acetyltransferase n=1 Tax=Crocosphaera sp. XPORK-15E TaxID=3110247 RepID=UPI002B20FC35|nr:GNAT family N-acetyltransferase [Crocosphaera sp. XPORK-15E]MEA5533928.1 GNAT family N-acetyltransferase [Crocosphaera sp. XPORK-15E]